MHTLGFGLHTSFLILNAWHDNQELILNYSTQSAMIGASTTEFNTSNFKVQPHKRPQWLTNRWSQTRLRLLYGPRLRNRCFLRDRFIVLNEMMIPWIALKKTMINILVKPSSKYRRIRASREQYTYDTRDVKSRKITTYFESICSNPR